ncbi:CHASE2 domain-containing protein [Sulfurovum sp. NBC37-1]|uniref:CHASE2 domain-containing protein n=1 Tax=Sulfurovum sp. (strain NBC37-1) TaxID=387093 RepID=UPI0001587B76|nr:adenylate/guanylate cyclase domain-containing protein [Sulfurovum sp. NBC37-1]BAF72802.1 adenylate cyclase/guanylate cyclase [Sulfurovum sp. NBC37-1]
MRSLPKYSIVLLFALLLSWAYLFPPQLFISLNTEISDFFFRMRGNIPQSQKVVIVDIDEASLEKYGQWPWSRLRVSELIRKINDAGAGIIGLDIIFAESDKTSPHSIASKLKTDIKNLDDYDQILRETFIATPTIGGYFFRFDKKTPEKAPVVPAVFIEKGLLNNYTIPQPKGVVLNIDILQESLYSSGFLNNIPDTDGMVRSVPLIMRYEGTIYPSLALELLRIYSHTKEVTVVGDEIGVKKIELGTFHIPTDFAGRLYVNYRSKRGYFKYISAADILQDHFDIKDIAGKFVLVGTSAIGLADLKAMPLDNVIPGVEIQANTLDNMLQGDYLHEPFNKVIYDLLILWCIIFVFSYIFFNTRVWLLAPAFMLSFILLYEIFFYLFFDQGIVLNLFFPLVALFGTFGLTAGYNYFSTSKQKESIQRIFAKKVSKAVMNDLLKHKNNKILEAHEQEVAIFFSDIRKFTTISETLDSSQKVVALLNRYVTPMVEDISRHEGTVDKFIGDSIMAYWNAPNNVADYMDKAVQSALSQIALLEALNHDLNVEFGVKLKIGIGIHTGLVTVGEMGSLERSDYTIIGDNVNIASRIEELNKLYDTTLIISYAAKERLKKTYTIRSLDIVRLRGQQKAIEIFEVLSSGIDEKVQKELEHYNKALTHYRKGELRRAAAEFEKLYARYKNKLYRLYLDRCAVYFNHPEKDFDLVYTGETTF